jgi:hypothetical protein
MRWLSLVILALWAVLAGVLLGQADWMPYGHFMGGGQP